MIIEQYELHFKAVFSSSPSPPLPFQKSLVLFRARHRKLEIRTTEILDEQDSSFPALKKNDKVCSGEDKWNQKRDENRRKDHYEIFISLFLGPVKNVTK